MVRIYFLHHSAVCVIVDKTLLVFDYYLHDGDKHIEDGHISKEDIACFERVYVFVSHSHHDHFNPVIFDWASDKVTYIIDSTVKATPRDAIILRPGEAYNDEQIYVREFGSTDCGGSFYVDINGTSLFHAGDLNDWHWKDEGNERYSRVMSKMFHREILYLKEHVAHIDYAFFPVDKRMGADHDAGARTFIDMMKPDVLIPIHFRSFADTQEFSESMADRATKVLSVQRMGERLV
jgi:L-ascorbate metabolism protein UlaG (beta-lactamase superfamily)